MNELKNMLYKERFKTKFKAILFGIIITILFVPFLFIHWLLYLFMIFAIGAVSVLLLREIRMIKLIDKVIAISHKDRVEVLEFMDKEIALLQDTVNAERTEMDVHAFNATNEHKAMLAANRNKLALEKQLGRLYNIRKIVEKYGIKVDTRFEY